MGAGTVASRVGGVVRGIALASALGAGTLADTFSLGNTLPNVVYILIIGGALNAVFIPELVRHMKDDGDDGQGYADRLITLVGTVLLVVSIGAVLLAPWIVQLYAPQYSAEQHDLATAFARFCLPQIFFYGVYTMLSQVLNARGHFGAPTFAPLLNNVIAIATFMLFIVVAGHLAPHRDDAPAEPGGAARHRHDARRRGPGARPGAGARARPLRVEAQLPAGAVPVSPPRAAWRSGPSGSCWSTSSPTSSSCGWRRPPT